MFVFLGDAQRLGPSEVKATKGQPASQALRHPSTPAASPSELLPAKESQDSPTARILGPAATVPPASTPAQKEKKKKRNLPERCPLLAAGILRTAWSEALIRVHGCPLVAARGIKHQTSLAPALWEGASQFMTVLSGQHLQFEVN